MLSYICFLIYAFLYMLSYKLLVSYRKGDVIEALGFRQSVDITVQRPNFSVGYPNGDTGVPAPFIRGVGLNDFGVLNQGPITAYTDQTYRY
jgi:hypothetical protein